MRSMIIAGMVSNSGNRWAVAGSTFLMWGLVAASAVYWATKLSNSGGVAPMAPVARTASPADPAAVARLLGASPTAAAAPASLSSRFNLLGIVSDPEHRGAALIAVDGKPAKPYRVGTPVDEGLLLQSVEPRRASLGATMGGPPAVTLELPLRK
jgi:general secretion pathway protein C